MRTFFRRAIIVVVLVSAMFGASAPIASAGDQLCPFVQISGARYEVCLNLI